tara:strand:+ start:156 stop:542 length:387 start_codon:yes stop_codon:yes gene_type:complete
LSFFFHPFFFQSQDTPANQPQSREELIQWIKLFQKEGDRSHGEINDFDVSLIEDFSQIFVNNKTFNEPIHSWDVSNGTNFKGLFLGAKVFNQVKQKNIAAAALSVVQCCLLTVCFSFLPQQYIHVAHQ